MAVLLSHERIQISGILHIVLGLAILAVGVVDRVEMTEHTSNFPAKYVLALWMGSWIVITGIVGLLISLRGINSKKSEVIIYLVFIIIAILCAMALLVCYSVSIAMIVHNEGSCVGLAPEECPEGSPYGALLVEKKCNLRVRLAVAEMFLSFLEIIAVWWTVFCFSPVIRKKPEITKAGREGHPAGTFTSTVQIDVKPAASGDRPVSYIVVSKDQQPETVAEKQPKDQSEL